MVRGSSAPPPLPPRPPLPPWLPSPPAPAPPRPRPSIAGRALQHMSSHDAQVEGQCCVRS
eukprot:3318882-Alexandrium_andersonii.AAC.1